MAHLQIPTAPSTTPLERSSESLSHRINASTRSIHFKLNQQILSRLPLAIPPHSATSSKYISGLLHIAPIYFEFESLWQEIVETACEPEGLHSVESQSEGRREERESESTDGTDQATPIHPRIHSLLSYLLMQDLLRSSALREDIQVLTKFSTEEIDGRLKAASQSGNLAEFLTHIRRSVKEKPHVLLAYAWVLYMALFSGGRILRKSLKDAGGAGHEFWERSPSPVRPLHPLEDSIREALQSPVSEDGPNPFFQDEESQRGRTGARSESPEPNLGMGLFSFVGDKDGEDIKIDFKKRFAEVELRLTPSEQEDVISEGQHIFSFMIGVVEDLDSICGTPADTTLERRRSSFDDSPESQPGYFDKLVKDLHLADSTDPMNDGLFWHKAAALAVPALGTGIVWLAWKMGR
ncbi:hypothetical protein HYFRA_00009345 [Hymenoscyphus fraxineus]|uniref:Heme oxygenase-like protein n=1 Tax=Hymenoscyphus fraxineus TaxID=746836 RepID=A0A9N9L109_9HELO|nr:hypothetical protein HYFRA_00009345 [Hymenoscyphus fraxineus]